MVRRIRRAPVKVKEARLDSHALEAIRQLRPRGVRLLNTITRGYIDRALASEAASMVETENDFRESLDSRETELLGYRRVSGQSNYDLNPVDQDNMLGVVVGLWQNNGLGKRMIEDVKDAVIGDGAKLKKTKHDKTDEVLEDFWWDKDNNWDQKGDMRVRELGLMGEMIATAYVSEHTGSVRLGYIDPSDVKDIEYNPQNKEEALFVVLKANTYQPEEIRLPVIRRDRTGEGGREARPKWEAAREARKAEAKRTGAKFGEAEMGKRFKTQGRLVGDQTKVGTQEPVGVFFVPVNKLRSQKRGLSDLWVPADFIDLWDKIIFDLGDRELLKKIFIWDIMKKGATPEDCKAYVKWLAINPPTTGSYQVHDENETWEAKTPNIEAVDSGVVADKVLEAACMGGRVPFFWYIMDKGARAESGKSKEQTSKATMYMLTQRQSLVKHTIEMMQDFAIDQAVLASHLKYKNDEEESEARVKTGVVMPKISPEDVESLASVIASLTPTMVTAEGQDWITKDDAAKVYAMLLSKAGMDVEPKDEEATVKDKSERIEFAKDLMTAWNNAKLATAQPAAPPQDGQSSGSLPQPTPA